MRQNPDLLIICTSCHLKREGGVEVFKGSCCTEYNAHLMNSKAFQHYSLNRLSVLPHCVQYTQTLSSLTLPAFTYLVNCFLLNYCCAIASSPETKKSAPWTRNVNVSIHVIK